MGRDGGLSGGHVDLAVGKRRSEQRPELAAHDDVPSPTAGSRAVRRPITSHPPCVAVRRVSPTPSPRFTRVRSPCISSTSRHAVSPSRSSEDRPLDGSRVGPGAPGSWSGSWDERGAEEPWQPQQHRPWTRTPETAVRARQASAREASLGWSTEQIVAAINRRSAPPGRAAPQPGGPGGPSGGRGRRRGRSTVGLGSSWGSGGGALRQSPDNPTQPA